MWDLFITHSWRYHDDWLRVSELLDAAPGLKWRNFSVPWYDPAMDPNTPVGGRFVRDWLETQIIPARGVIFLASVYERGSAKRWLSLEVDFARRHSKPIVGLPTHGTEAFPDDCRTFVDAVAGWDAGNIITTFEQLAGAGAAKA